MVLVEYSWIISGRKYVDVGCEFLVHAHVNAVSQLCILYVYVCV